ncbi:MAG: hypothetical protein QXU13_06930, partial [Desulfurococcaceae archaeon]
IRRDAAFREIRYISKGREFLVLNIAESKNIEILIFVSSLYRSHDYYIDKNHGYFIISAGQGSYN